MSGVRQGLSEGEIRMLLETVEIQARQIETLRERLDRALDGAGAAPRIAAIRPAPPPPRPAYARPAPRVPAAEIEGWPRAVETPRPLRPNPGWACHTLKAEDCDVVGYPVFGLPQDALARAVGAVDALQRAEGGFVPLFLTDEGDFSVFRNRGYAFEQFPARSGREAPGTVSWETYAGNRLALIRAKWGLKRLVRLGRELPGTQVPPVPGTQVPPDPPHLVFFPDYTEANPYQALLYRAVAGRIDARAGTIEDARVLLAAAGERTPVFFHLHWEDAVYRAARSGAEAEGACDRFLSSVERFVAEGGRLVWTVHNLEPHDRGDPACHDRLWRALPRLAHAVLAHSPAAADAVADRAGLRPGGVRVVPHGNYDGVHEGPGSRAEGRRRLGVPSAATLFLFFGKVRAYKGVDTLIDAFDLLGADLLGADLPETEQAFLAVAGRQHDALVLDGLPESTRARLRMLDGAIPSDEVPDLFAAADFAVLPYRDILTSGSLLLAFTQHRPVIAPAFDTVAELVEDGVNGILYDPRDPWGLPEALRRAAALPGEERLRMAAAAGETAARYAWGPIGDRLADILLPPAAAPRRAPEGPGGRDAGEGVRPRRRRAPARGRPA